jgi:hypothetical protein
MAWSSFRAALGALSTGGIEFIVVGRLAAELRRGHSGPIAIEVVVQWGEDNLARLLAVLESMDASYRLDPEKRIRPNASRFRSHERHNLLTLCGPLDILAATSQGARYEDLLPQVVEMEIGGDVRIRVLEHPTP